MDDPAAVLAEHEVVERQAGHPADLRHDTRCRHAVLDALQQRRTERGDLVQCEAIPDGGFDLLDVAGALIVTRRDLDGERVRGLMDELDLEASPLDRVRGVVRLIPRGTDRLG